MRRSIFTVIAVLALITSSLAFIAVTASAQTDEPSATLTASRESCEADTVTFTVLVTGIEAEHGLIQFRFNGELYHEAPGQVIDGQFTYVESGGPYLDDQTGYSWDFIVFDEGGDPVGVIGSGPLVLTPGCQPADTDGDGVPDDQDECPDTEEDVVVGDDGCPLEDPRPSRNVTICHATASETNPFVSLSAAPAGIYNGHIAHQHGEDIVPPFEFKGNEYSQNWDAEGQAIWNNNCVVPDDTPPPPPGDEDDDDDSPPPPSPSENTPEATDSPRRNPSVKGSNSSQAVEHTVGHTA